MFNYEEQLRQLIGSALREDIGEGDHSTMSCIDAHAKGRAVLKIKQEGTMAGIKVAEKIFATRDPNIFFHALKEDGEEMKPGEFGFDVEGSVHTILQCERVVLNCMQRMSGIATLTRQYTRKLEGYRTRLLDTRKTTPNFRLLEKDAVRIGGAFNHRFGLFDMIMLKDNHIDYCGGIGKAIEKAYEYVQLREPSLKIEVETRNLEDVKKAVAAGKGKIFRIMLDNFQPEVLAEALQLIGGEFETEASGGIHLDNIEEYAKTGVDFVSVGALIHQARSLDMSLKAVMEQGG
jgi:nicotinate-nucleotide pyrophosphorylase (carboxylating)